MILENWYEKVFFGVSVDNLFAGSEWQFFVFIYLLLGEMK